MRRSRAGGRARGWVEHPTLAHFRRDVLRKLHARKLIEFDARERTVLISPSGVDYVESKLIRTRCHIAAA